MVNHTEVIQHSNSELFELCSRLLFWKIPASLCVLRPSMQLVKATIKLNGLIIGMSHAFGHTSQVLGCLQLKEKVACRDICFVAAGNVFFTQFTELNHTRDQLPCKV
jgi:hypothetical protein